MNEAKIRLSTEEAALITNAAIILTKNEIINKVYQLFGRLSEKQRQQLELLFIPNEVKKISPKIAKGENYKGLPWLMLDYPRLFAKENMLAIRTMFWWGNYLSTTLLLSGSFKKSIQENCIIYYERLCAEYFYICIEEHPWDHHFDEANYQAIAQLSQLQFQQLVLEKSFLKISAKLNLEEWDNAEDLLMKQYETLLRLINHSK